MKWEVYKYDVGQPNGLNWFTLSPLNHLSEFATWREAINFALARAHAHRPL